MKGSEPSLTIGKKSPNASMPETESFSFVGLIAEKGRENEDERERERERESERGKSGSIV